MISCRFALQFVSINGLIQNLKHEITCRDDCHVLNCRDSLDSWPTALGSSNDGHI